MKWRQFAEVFVPTPVPTVDVIPEPESGYARIVTRWRGRVLCARIDRVKQDRTVPGNWTYHERT